MNYDDDEPLLEHDDAPYLRDETHPKYELMIIAHELEEEIASMDTQNDVTALLGVRGTVIVRESDSKASPLRATVRQAYKIFLHPQGTHCLVSTSDGNLYYYNIKTRKSQTHFLLQHTAKNNSETASPTSASIVNIAETVLWSNTTDTKSTGPILIGTKLGGNIFEVRIEYANGETSIAVCRQIAQIPSNASSPITGLDFETVNGTTVVLVTTPTRFCRIQGVGEARKVLYEQSKTMNFQELPSGSDNPARGSLSIFRSRLGGEAQSYAWSSSMGIVHGLFAHKRDEEDDDDLDPDEPLMNHTMLTLHKRPTAGQASANAKLGLPDKTPSEVMLSGFHMLLLYEDRFLILNHPAGLTWKPLNGSELQEYDISERVKFDPFRYRKQRRLLGLVRDAAQRRMYLYNGQCIWEILLEQEHHTQWKLFLERAIDVNEEPPLRKKYYRAAFNLSRGNPQRQDLVQYSRGLFYLQQKNPDMATTILAQCNRFEDIYVQLMQQKSQAILRKFLEKRYKLLVQFRKSKQSMQSQIACLAMHLVQLKLDNISKCEGDETLMHSAIRDLDSFLAKSVNASPDAFDDKPYYQMMAKAITCQGRIPTMLSFAQLLHRVHYTISFYVSQTEYSKACDVLIKYCTKDERYAEAWYDFCPMIIVHCPVKLITGLLKAVIRHPDGAQEHMLEIERLIPAFIRYQPRLNEVANNTEHQVIVFIERCIEKYGCYSAVIHNYYVSLLAQFDHERLADFFMADQPQYFTTEYALRRCLELHRFQQCIPLYKKLGLYEDAICIAMECSRPEGNGRWHGLQAAKEILREVNDEIDLVAKKKLWSMVAERVIDQIGTKQALSIVEESNGVLKLEDVLAKINDNTVIQNFKEAVCRSLDEYTGAISDLNAQQREAFQISESVKREIRDLKNRYGYVTSKQKCYMCQRGLLQGAMPFLVYPSCRHVFHEACVVQRLEALGGLEGLRNAPGLPHGYLDDIYSLDDLAAAECVYCGECAVLEITKDFFIEGDDASWSTD